MTTKRAQNTLIDRPYSHGFESIYAFETIDTSSIRVMNTAPTQPITATVDIKEQSPVQPEFSFIRSSISPFFLKESIEILKLSSHAERFLRALGHELIQDLLHLDFNDLSFLRGLGQGHIEEIRTKLKEFIQGRSLEGRTTVDYISWARSLFRGMDKRVVGVVFEKFGLMNHLPLNTSERVEIKKLPQERKQEWLYQFKETCRSHHATFDESLHSIFEAFVKPWMLARGGFASAAELCEFGWRLGDERSSAEYVLAMFSELFCDGAHPFFRLQESLIPGVYVAHYESYRMITRITKVLRSYFYDESLEYSLEELISWVEREFACAWIDLNSTALKKAIRCSPAYEVLQVFGGKVVVRLARSRPEMHRL